MNKVANILMILALVLGLMGLGCSKDSEPAQPSGGEAPALQTPADPMSDTVAQRSRAPRDRGSGRRSRTGRGARADQTPAAVESDLLQRLPDNMLGFITTSGGDILKPGFDRSILGQMWREPEVQDFCRSIKDALLSSLEEQISLEQSGELLGIKRLAEQAFQRPMVIGAAQLEGGQGPPVYGFLIIDAGARRREIASAISELEGLASKGEIVDVKIATETFHGPRETGGVPGYWGWVGDYFVFALNEDSGLAFRHLTEGADQPPSTGSRVLEKVPGNDDALALYVDCQRAGQLVQTIPQDQPQLALMQEIIKSLGLGEIKSLTARVGFAGPDMVGNTLIEAPQPYTGLLQCLRPVDMAQLDMVDADAVKVTVVDIDLTTLYDTIIRAIQTALPPEQFNQLRQGIAAAEQQMGVQIRDGLLAGVAGPMTLYTLPPDPGQTTQSARPPTDPAMAMNPFAMQQTMEPGATTVLVAGLKDAARMEKSLAALAQFAQIAGEQLGLQVTTQQIGNQTVYSLNVAALAMIMPIAPSWTILGDRLIFATSADACGSALKRITSSEAAGSIRSRSDFQEMTADLPRNLLSFSYTDSKFQFRQMAALLQQSWPLLAMTAQQQQINLPMEFPSLDKFAEQMGPALKYCWTDNDGIHSHGQLAAAESAAAVGVAALSFSITMPALGRARELAKRVQCQSNLAVIGRSIAMYQGEYGDKNPGQLEDLIIAENLPPKSLVCPSSDDEPGQCSYIYRGEDLTSSASGDMILAYDKFENHNGECRNVLFASFAVKRMTEDVFQQAIAIDNLIRRQKGLPEKPADMGEPTRLEEPRPVEAITDFQKEVDPAQRAAQQLECAGRLEAVGQAVINYQKRFRGMNPALLEDLTVTADLAPEELLCPATGDQPGTCSYIYRGADLNASAAAEMILAYDRRENHGDLRNVLFADAAVKKLTEPEFQQAIAKDNELRRQKDLPEKPVDK